MLQREMSLLDPNAMFVTSYITVERYAICLTLLDGTAMFVASYQCQSVTQFARHFYVYKCVNQCNDWVYRVPLEEKQMSRLL